MTRAASILAVSIAVVLLAGASTRAQEPGGKKTEVVVLLASPPLGRAPGTGAEIDAEQRTFRRELSADVPSAQIGWRYRLVANGFSLTLPRAELGRLGALPGVRRVLPSATYAPQSESSAAQIGAPSLWGPTLDSAGQGMKIGIIDSGVDPSHPYFDPSGYTMPSGFPKGQLRFTTAKVIVARVFAPKGVTSPSARLAFSPDDSSHGTHVAGIAAGNVDTAAAGRRISGVAPRAYIGNYKVFVETSSGLSPNANAPAIVAAIEAAVRDGMDVINFSGGEPEIEPSRDIVALALDAAAAAGVVPVVAAGNEYGDVGAGSVSSPANSARAIAVGAADMDGTTRAHADFSSVGPTTISLRLKPDVSAPGVNVLSSIPGGGWGELSGTSMAAPHVAGAAALLRQRHPGWTVEEIKSALVQSGVDESLGQDKAAGPRFQGGGVVALGRADQPLVFADPTAVSFGLLSRGRASTQAVALTDAGGGAGTWQVSGNLRTPEGVKVRLPATVTVPGQLPVSVTVGSASGVGDVEGYIELRRGTDQRRIPLWGRVTAAALAQHVTTPLLRPGIYHGTTAGQPAFVSRYRYPETPRGIGVTTILRGPERVFRVRISKRVANFGVVVTSRGAGSHVEPRVVSGLDEDRLTGFAGLPVNHNPYTDQFDSGVLAAGALSPARGEYAIVFDSAARVGAGSFTFRYWVNDVTAPRLRVPSHRVRAGSPLLVSATDAGAGVYPDSIQAKVDGSIVDVRFRHGVVSVPTRSLGTGTHKLRLRVSDYQEAKNTENVGPILPNTRWLTTTFEVR